MIVFRHADPRYPFLWEDSAQPAARWHGPGEGPTHYFADTPDGAWAEFIRHEEIRDPVDLTTIRRSIWAVEVPDEPRGQPRLPARVLTGGPESYPTCQQEARRLRSMGRTNIEATSAALLPGGGRGWRVDGGLRAGPPRDGKVIVLFDRRPNLVGWAVTAEGRPDEEILGRVRHFRSQKTSEQRNSV